MDLILDSWHVLARHGELVAFILAWAGWAAVLILAGLKGLPGVRLTGLESFALAIAGWPAPVLSVSFLVFLLAVFTSAPAAGSSLALMAITAVLAVCLWRRTEPVMERGGSVAVLVAGLVVLVLIFLRLAYIDGTLVPQYFDSAEHYRITQALMRRMGSTPPAGPWSWPAPTYYHLGFHMLAAFVSSVSGADPKTVILVLGQVLLACIAVSFFFIIKHATGSSTAALLAVWLAGFGWYMPAHAVDWGKYPALAGLLAVQFSLYLAYLRGTEPDLFSRSRVFRVLLLSSLAVSFFMHTRSIIVFAIVIASWAAAGNWVRFPQRGKLLTLFTLISLLVWFYVWAGSNDLGMAFDPYVKIGIPATAIVLLLSPFAFGIYPRHAFCALLSILLMLCGLLIPVPGLPPGLGVLSLLDRPFVEMALFVPLAWIGGLGCAGLIQRWGVPAGRRAGTQAIAQAGITVLISGMLAVHALGRTGFYPSDCCRIVDHDDVAAFDWLERRLQPGSVIAIAAAELSARSFSDSPPYAGTDAGVWIGPLTGGTTVRLPYELDFGREDTLQQLCDQDISYIYRGGTQRSFGPSGLNDRPEWYRTIFNLPGAQIIEIAGCP